MMSAIVFFGIMMLFVLLMIIIFDAKSDIYKLKRRVDGLDRHTNALQLDKDVYRMMLDQVQSGNRSRFGRVNKRLLRLERRRSIETETPR